MSQLTLKQQNIIPISAFTAGGDLQRLSFTINKGLDAGLTINEIKEIQIQLYAYAGFPRAINAVSTLMTIVKERQSQNIHDEIGKDASPISNTTDMLALGTKVQTQLAGKVVEGHLFDFAPTLNQYLRAHLFGDIFARDILSYQDREIATIAALSVINGADSQLKAHYQIGLNAGLTQSQLFEIVQLITATVDQNTGNHAKSILEQ
ncbi:carboxymuconolactone decarboxylase family protein [Commensalibacter communis]|uniref:carboxymuconolactone decarboxylase family protein n=1 Tax=Commensalibacter communis TaxID=2972786 RepID=UPI0022FF7789|nr:carboxymuconolactone decarboxylase family protein [Commensalibacter communis]CAI3953026.1 Uncharacterized conserved protein YurZ [Commensalibacter communis]CAI3953426.1 Uncharacterized conserved protein YurZ [Commensalibacter communis]